MKIIRNITSAIITLIILLSISCGEEDNIITDPIIKEELTSDSVQILDINNFKVELSEKGELSSGILKNEDVGVLFLGGLWIGIESSDGPSGNIVYTGALPYSNYTSKREGKQLGVYYLTKDEHYSSENWPVEYGAPVDNDGLPKIYGDGMCWTSLVSDTLIDSKPQFSKPIKNIQVSQSVYGFTREDLSNAVFVKYRIKNLSSEIWNDMYLGFYTDTDLWNAGDNSTGYDSARAISYTYCTESNYVSGYSFLETPKSVGIKSHRIMRKNNYSDPEYGEWSFNSPEQILYTLKGLSNNGEVMINPETGLESFYAFTGDPITGIGWLDVQVDVRSILTTDKFSLTAGETTEVTVVYVVANGSTLSESLSTLKTTIQSIKAEGSL